MKEAYDLYVQSGYNFEVSFSLGRPQSVENSISIIISLKSLLLMPLRHNMLPSITLPLTFKINSWKMMIQNMLNTSNSSKAENHSLLSIPCVSTKAFLTESVSLIIRSSFIFQKGAIRPFQNTSRKVCVKKA